MAIDVSWGPFEAERVAEEHIASDGTGLVLEAIGATGAHAKPLSYTGSLCARLRHRSQWKHGFLSCFSLL